MPSEAPSPIMAALEKFEATEANLSKLERLWSELEELTPTSIQFGEMPEHEERARAYVQILGALPAIDGWRPEASPMDLNDLAQNRLDALELGEPGVEASIEAELARPSRELREYRFRLNNKRRALIRDSLVSLVDTIDEDVRTLRAEANATDPARISSRRDVEGAA